MKKINAVLLTTSAIILLILPTSPVAYAAEDPPQSTSAAINLGGSAAGMYTDSSGNTFDGTGFTVVDIDGGFQPTAPSIKGKIEREACIGQPAGATYTAWWTLCNTTNFVSRPLPGIPSAGYYFSSLSDTAGHASSVDNSPYNSCQESNLQTMTPCHWYHGTATASLIAGKQLIRYESATDKRPYGGVAPGAKLIPIKVGGGTSQDNKGWPIQSVVDALTYVNNGLLNGSTNAQKIVAVNISASGGPLPEGTACTGSDAVKINELAGLIKAKGVAVVMSAGNNGITGTGTWNCGSNIIRVGATSVSDPKTPTNYSNVSQDIPLYAPVGSGNCAEKDCLLAAYPLLDSTQEGSFYVSGTSFAAPQVAGALAVLHSKFGRDVSVDRLVTLLKDTGTPISGPRVGATAGSSINISAALNQTP